MVRVDGSDGMELKMDPSPGSGTGYCSNRIERKKTELLSIPSAYLSWLTTWLTSTRDRLLFLDVWLRNQDGDVTGLFSILPDMWKPAHVRCGVP